MLFLTGSRIQFWLEHLCSFSRFFDFAACKVASIDAAAPTFAAALIELLSDSA